MKYSDLKYLSVELPEAINKEKWSGNFDETRKLINTLLTSEGTPNPLRCRLELELNNMNYIQARYTVSEEEALQIMRRRIPKMTKEELEILRREDKADWMYIDGEVKYIDCFDATLYKVYPQIWEMTDEGDTSDYTVIQRVAEEAKANGDGFCMKAHIHIRHDFWLKKESVEQGKILKVHMPVPIEAGSVKNLKLVDITPEYKFISQNALQPTIYFEVEAEEGQVFSVEYEMDNSVAYRDTSRIDLKAVDETPVPEEERQYLAEELPHIRFTPYLKALAEEIAAGETNLLRLARKFYDFITTETDYRFVRDYCSIDNLPEYCALNKRGDCGVQALLFITLCRIAGIPARWQSGLDAKPGDVGEHDWAMFYIPTAGWLYADLSYGGSSYIRGAYDRWNFFFGNVDPWRIPINNGFQKQFVPPKNRWRIDPYDNQCGEAEYEHRGLTADEVEYAYTEIFSAKTGEI